MCVLFAHGDFASYGDDESKKRQIFNALDVWINREAAAELRLRWLSAQMRYRKGLHINIWPQIYAQLVACTH